MSCKTVQSDKVLPGDPALDCRHIDPGTHRCAGACDAANVSPGNTAGNTAEAPRLKIQHICMMGLGWPWQCFVVFTLISDFGNLSSFCLCLILLFDLVLTTFLVPGSPSRGGAGLLCHRLGAFVRFATSASADSGGDEVFCLG